MSCTIAGPLGQYDMAGENAIPQGATWPVKFNYSINGSTYNFATYTGKLQVRRTYDTPVLLELNTTNGGITLTGTDPNVTLNFTAAFTTPMTTYSEMIYDLELYGPTGDTIKFIWGNFELFREVTK